MRLEYRHKYIHGGHVLSLLPQVKGTTPLLKRARLQIAWIRDTKHEDYPCLSITSDIPLDERSKTQLDSLVTMAETQQAEHEVIHEKHLSMAGEAEVRTTSKGKPKLPPKAENA